MSNSSRLSCLAAVLSIGLVQLAGCSWHPQRGADGEEDSLQTVQVRTNGDAVRLAVAQTGSRLVGSPYRYGGSEPDGFDCSGLVYFSYQRAGVRVPRTSAELLEAAAPIGLANAQPGDLLFFRDRRKVSHVAIYLGDDKFVHAPSTGKRVTVGSLNDPYYSAHFVRAGRVYSEP